MTASLPIAVGLPSGAARASADEVVEWALRAEAGPFSSVAVLDRGVSVGFEPLTVLAAVAAATRRIGLLASVVIGPMRETTLLARQATTVDALSGGRMALGLGIGVRKNDYVAAGVDFHARGRRLDAQLPVLRRLLQGERLSDDIGSVGLPPVRPGGPPLLVGGYVGSVGRRIAAWGDGFVSPGGGDLADMVVLWGRIEEAWRDAGRSGAPRWVAASYYALGPRAAEQAAKYIDAMYGYDPALAGRRLAMIPTSVAGLRALIEAHAAAGVDELLLRPCAQGFDQLERLADAVG
jgi:alkanesulfonate monooxygenase SsuD/methylene tetrahydromethanopterin reductase-like flavin-dependent oxidoreductase (luciferase family)